MKQLHVPSTLSKSGSLRAHEIARTEGAKIVVNPLCPPEYMYLMDPEYNSVLKSYEENNELSE